jgi:hypothetical protein
MLHDRAYGRPPQVVSVDIALRKAVENLDPAEQLRVLQDMRASASPRLSAGVKSMTLPSRSRGAGFGGRGSRGGSVSAGLNLHSSGSILAAWL